MQQSQHASTPSLSPCSGQWCKTESFQLPPADFWQISCRLGISCHFKEGSSRFLFHGKPLHSATHLRYGSGPYRTRKMSPGSPLPSVSKLNKWCGFTKVTSQFHPPCDWASKTDPFRWTATCPFQKLLPLTPFRSKPSIKGRSQKCLQTLALQQIPPRSE